MERWIKSVPWKFGENMGCLQPWWIYRNGYFKKNKNKNKGRVPLFYCNLDMSNWCICYYVSVTEAEYVLKSRWFVWFKVCQIFFLWSKLRKDFYVISDIIIYYLNSPEGIESLCSDIEVSHTDVRILMLAW